jgi:hypothetical protein
LLIEAVASFAVPGSPDDAKRHFVAVPTVTEELTLIGRSALSRHVFVLAPLDGAATVNQRASPENYVNKYVQFICERLVNRVASASQ